MSASPEENGSIEIFSEYQSNWTSCPLGSKSVQMKINSTSLLNYYSIRNVTQISAMPFELPLIADVSGKIRFHSFDLSLSIWIEFNSNQNLCFLWEHQRLTQPILYHRPTRCCSFIIGDSWHLSTLNANWPIEEWIVYQSVRSTCHRAFLLFFFNASI